MREVTILDYISWDFGAYCRTVLLIRTSSMSPSKSPRCRSKQNSPRKPVHGPTLFPHHFLRRKNCAPEDMPLVTKNRPPEIAGVVAQSNQFVDIGSPEAWGVKPVKFVRHESTTWFGIAFSAFRVSSGPGMLMRKMVPPPGTPPLSVVPY